MSLLIVQLPPRARLLAGGVASRAGAAAGLQFAHVLSPDGRQVEREGRAPLALLPRATSTVLVLAPGDLAFHRLRVPKAPAARLRLALAGLLEDQLLDEPEALHLALAPGAQAGTEAWLAVGDRAALRAQVEAFEAAGHAVDRIVPARAPGRDGSLATLDVFGPVDEHDAPEQAWIELSDATGLRSLHWDSRSRPGPLVQALLPEPLPPELVCRAAPALVQATEAWLGRPVEVQPLTQQLLEAARGDWNLRQFELAPRHRGATWLRDAAARARSPAWKPVRWGLAGLVAAQLLGLNAWAWQERSALAERRAGLQQILRATHPQVRAILDAPLQMQRENEALRAAAGRAGDGDLEPLLQAAASAWPEQLPVQSLRYENARLTLDAPGLDEAAIDRLRSSLQPAGWRVEGSAGSLTLQRAADGGGR